MCIRDSGAAAELVTPLEIRVFTLEEASDDGSSLYRAEWVAKLPHKLSQNQEMEVSLSLSCLTGGSSGLVSLPDSVSYTQLDVYKRQDIDLPRRGLQLHNLLFGAHRRQGLQGLAVLEAL